MELRDTKQTIHATNADLSDSAFTNVRLAGATFSDVNLTGAVIDNVNLSGVHITHANLTGASIDGIAVTDLLKAFHLRKDLND